MTNTGKPVVILGPTASGKSDTAMAVARVTNTEIVVCDAMQVYRGMDIGTAKPTRADREAVVHHCLDLVEATERFTVSDYQHAARSAVADVVSRGANALVVAGTGLYLTALIDDLEFPGEFPAARREIEHERHVDVLYRRLEELDPLAASRIEPTNRRRIERALEVTIGSGKPFSSFGPGTGAYPDNGVVQIGILWPREILAARVEARVHAMMEAGFLDEVKGLLESRSLSHTARQALGYAELIDHIHGECSLDEAVSDIIVHTRQFAVRQERWFRRDPRIRWVEVHEDPVSEIAPVVQEFLH